MNIKHLIIVAFTLLLVQPMRVNADWKSAMMTKSIKIALVPVLISSGIAAKALYNNGYFNWLSRIVFDKKYKKIQQFQSQLNLNDKTNYASWRITNNYPSYFPTPAAVLCDSKNVLKTLVFDFDNIRLCDDQIRTHDFTSHLTAVNGQLKQLEQNLAELASLLGHINPLQKINDAERTALGDLNQQKLDGIQQQFFSDVSVNDDYSWYALAKKTYFEYWKVYKRLRALQAVLQDAPIL